ncbi:conserved hypothetical protein [Culex quinquefasciatus]|uniref:Uncharacterized protein n=1 Tax=Culex quinquefasciatus TaxID=7176 RepID=B0XA09_CULQU|nr:conserved hypothetical protein [Culex quinquefasciatus]|eukprot:XP_001866481.1 conserved hypothetical protein [Culex quinquefasciatus]
MPFWTEPATTESIFRQSHVPRRWQSYSFQLASLNDIVQSWPHPVLGVKSLDGNRMGTWFVRQAACKRQRSTDDGQRNGKPAFQTLSGSANDGTSRSNTTGIRRRFARSISFGRWQLLQIELGLVDDVGDLRDK